MKNLLLALGFSPKENTQDVYSKKYPLCGGYEISIDYKKQTIEYGSLIKSESKTTGNHSQDENWVVLECVDRLLSKGYQPSDITLEKTWQLGHMEKGRLDIHVKKDGRAYLLIECKTYGKEFDKEWQNTKKKGGQLFSYFQQDRDAEFLMLYASELRGNTIVYTNEIIKIESDYRLMGNVEDLYNRWNKFSKQNGIFESWARAYHFESKALTLADLADIRQEDSSFIFNRFLEILRHNAVSDKPNAFNKIFTLFLCKIKDEDKNPDDELDFQWKEGEDDAVSFQKRLSDLYRKGMEDFLSKEITDVSDADFHKKFGAFITNEDTKRALLEDLTRLRLHKNNEFAIKEVFDKETFEDNSKVLKEVVELLQNFRFRYAKKQPFLGDFFELLLTTGLKQEAGQFFTPVPIARFISKSVPLEAITRQKLATGATDELLPNIIDYAAGSGHFLTESMEELQNIISRLDLTGLPPSSVRAVKPWQHDNPFAWAHDYIYGVELDYRLVKTTKVGCYLHGDGIANVIHGDGLDSFTDGNYTGKLRKKIPGTQDNGQFDFVLANPPYSVSACKGNLKNKNADKDFDLYKYLTDQSSQIESLFIERTKQLLTEGGIAAIILPSSILSNGGIYTHTREILLRYFEFVAITELGSGTFMATGTNTVILFLRRRNNLDHVNIEAGIANFFANHKDVTLASIENPITKYIAHVWGDISLDDYISLITDEFSDKIISHEITREYEKKIKSKDRKDWVNQVREIEKDKLLYFLLAYGQELVLVKSGDKQDEKNFLGYEFSNRKGDEGIHPTRRGKLIDDCTLLYHPEDVTHPERVNTYILDAFTGKYDRTIAENLSRYVSRAPLVDMLTWDRAELEKNISLSVKKKIKIESKWGIVKIKDICEIGRGRVISKKEIDEKPGSFPVYSSQTSDNGIFGYIDSYDFDGEYVTWTTDGIYAGTVFYRTGKFNCTNVCGTLLAKSDHINMKFLSRSLQLFTYQHVVKVANPKLMNNVMAEISIPLPPLDIQEQIVREIEVMEKREEGMKEEVDKQKKAISEIIGENLSTKEETLGNIVHIIRGVTYSKDDQVSERTKNIILPADNILLEGGLNISKEVFLREDFSINPEKRLMKDDIFMCFSSGSMQHLGKVAFIEYESPYYAGGFMGILRSKGNVSPKFLYTLLNSNTFRDKVRDTGSGSNINNLSQSLGNVKIPLPPLSEQSRIVAEIEHIESEISRLEVELASIPAEKEAILKKYL